MNTTELYHPVAGKATADPDLQAELQAIAGQDEEIRDRFYRSLEFGTARAARRDRRPVQTV